MATVKGFNSVTRDLKTWEYKHLHNIRSYSTVSYLKCSAFILARSIFSNALVRYPARLVNVN